MKPEPLVQWAVFERTSQSLSRLNFTERFTIGHQLHHTYDGKQRPITINLRQQFITSQRLHLFPTQKSVQTTSFTLSVSRGNDVKCDYSVVLSTEKPDPVHHFDHLKHKRILSQIVAGFEHRQTQIGCVKEEIVWQYYLCTDLLIMLQRAAPLLGREGGMSEGFGRKRRKGKEGRRKRK